MKIKKSKTNRGFGLVEFKDSKGEDCSIQMSSIATEEAIWFGCDNANPQYFIPNGNPSWRKLEVPKDTIFNTRMHLTRKQVEKLIPILQQFVDTGLVGKVK